MPDEPTGTDLHAASPYRGLVPFSEDDASVFFGRDRERQIIVANLLAYRLTLLYGESGVGKTSVLRAGAVHQLRRQSRESLEELGSPEFVVVEFASWRDDPVAALAEAVDRSVLAVLGDRAPDPPKPSLRLDERLEAWAERLDTQFLVILDQFEEYLLYHWDEDGDGTFAVEFPRAVNRPDLRANFLVAIREDALARLDRFKSRIPGLFGNYLRIRHLEREAARQAIVGPIEEHNRLFADGAPFVTIEPELVDAVLDQVKTGKVQVGETGQGIIAHDDRQGDASIETPYLQLVLSRLWEEEHSAGSPALRLVTLERLGGAERIVRTHLDEAMSDLPQDDREAAARVFRFLVTPGGTKIAHTAADLAQYAEISEARLGAVLESLAGGDLRILRAGAPPPGEMVPRYEIFHDVLAPAILDWQSRHEEGRRQAEALARERREGAARARRVRRRWGLVALVIAGIFGVMSFLSARQRSVQEAATLTFEALAQLDQDPQRAVRLALASLDVRPTAHAEDTLRLALSQSRLTSVIGDHHDVVWSAAFSPDGERVVTASSDSTARISEAATGFIIAELRGHADVVTGAAFTPGGDRVVTASMDGAARVWDAQSGEELLVLEHVEPVYLAASETFDAHGRYVATGPFTGDGALLVTSAGTSAWIWDLSTGTLLRRLEHPAESFLVATSAFSPDGTLVVTAALDGFVRLWEVATGEPLPDPMDNETLWVSMATFSPDGTLVAAANSDGSVGLWNPSTGEMKWGAGHTHEVVTVAFSPDGGRLVSAADSTARVWEVGEDPEGLLRIVESAVIRPHASWMTGARFSPDGNYVVTSNEDGTARVADAFTGEALFALRGHEDVVWTAVFGPIGDRVATASEDGTARVWNVDTGLQLRGHIQGVNSVVFSPDGTRLATASVDETAGIWDARTGEEIHTLFGDVDEFGWFSMNSAAFSPDGGLVVTAQQSGTVALWDSSTGLPVGICCDYDGYFAYDAAFLADRTRMVVLYADGTARVWDLGTNPQGVQRHIIDDVLGMAVSPDGRWIVTAGRWDKMARIWDADNFALVREWEAGLVKAIVVSPDGRRVAMAGVDRVIRIWDTSTERLLIDLAGSTSGVSSLAFSPDGSWLVSGGADGTTRVWDAESGRPLALLRMHADAVQSLDIGTDGRIVSASNDRTAKIYGCDTCGSIDEVIERARELAAMEP
jgi:WD40 repeat protein